MSTLLEFLVDNPIDNLTEEVIVSQRLSKFPFKIKAMNGPEFAEYQKMATKIGKRNKIEFNQQLFNELVILNNTIEPNFKEAEMIKKAGCNTPEQFLYTRLLAGEIAELAKKISALSGFETEFNELVDEAKNS